MATKSTTLVPLSGEYAAGCLQLLLDSFRLDEPCVRQLAWTVEQCRPHFEELIAMCVDNGVSFVAINDSRNVIGCRLSKIKTKGQEDQPFQAPLSENMTLFFEFMDELSGSAFEDFPNASKVCQFMILAVAKEYRRCGIAEGLVKLSIEQAERHGCDYIVLTASSQKSQDLFVKLGFATLRVKYYQGYSVGGRQVFGDLGDEGACMKLMYKKL